MISSRPKIVIVTTGGTIAMTPSASGGVRPALSGAELVANIEGIDVLADIEARSFAACGSANLTFAHALELAALVRSLPPDAVGVVVTQGTDTLEEMAFLLDCLLKEDRPVVFTGAMRPPQSPGADGPANLFDATCVACHPAFRGFGVLAVMNGEIHAARTVTKAHTSAASAFVSPGSGPLGLVSEGRVHLFAHPVRPVLPDFSDISAPLPKVALLPVSFSDDCGLLDAVTASGYAGIVVAALGAGHVPEHFVSRLETLAARIPVLLSTRIPAGPVFEKTYGYQGAEIDLIRRGLIPAGVLPAHKARILLTLLLAAGCGKADIQRAFAF